MLIYLLKEIYNVIKMWAVGRVNKYNFLRNKVKIENGVFVDKTVKIGVYTFIGAHASIGPATASIGKFCSIASGCIIGPNSHNMKSISTSTFPVVAQTPQKLFGKRTPDQLVFYSRYKESLNQFKVVVEDDVWLGHNVIILPGVRIGTGAVIGSASVVTRDVKPYCIVAGVPAAPVRTRFSDQTIATLLRYRVYQRDPDRLLELFHRYSRENLESVLPLFLSDLENIPLEPGYKCEDQNI